MSFCLFTFSVFFLNECAFYIRKKEHLPCFAWRNKDETLYGTLTFLILLVCSIPDYKLKQEKKQTGADFLTISSSPSSPHGIFFFPIWALILAFLQLSLLTCPWSWFGTGQLQEMLRAHCEKEIFQSTLRDLSAKAGTNPQFFTEEHRKSEIPALRVSEIFLVY